MPTPDQTQAQPNSDVADKDIITTEDTEDDVVVVDLVSDSHPITFMYSAAQTGATLAVDSARTLKQTVHATAVAAANSALVVEATGKATAFVDGTLAIGDSAVENAFALAARAEAGLGNLTASTILDLASEVARNAKQKAFTGAAVAAEVTGLADMAKTVADAVAEATEDASPSRPTSGLRP